MRLEDRPGHIRTPWYIRGKSGWIERVYGDFLNPEELGVRPRRIAEANTLFVAFKAMMFGESPWIQDKVLVDIYEHWLDPCLRRINRMSDHTGQTPQDHEHPKHELSYYAKRIYAIRDLCSKRRNHREGYPVPSRIPGSTLAGQRRQARRSCLGRSGVQGASYCRSQSCLRRDGNRRDQHQRVCGLENTEKVRHMVVCTLCSCYPRPILGRPPDWYKSFNYRQRAVNDPRGVMREFGLVLPDDVEVRVHDSTADIRYLVLPLRPKGTEGLSETELAKLVTRDSMIGVMDALPEVPQS